MSWEPTQHRTFSRSWTRGACAGGVRILLLPGPLVAPSDLWVKVALGTFPKDRGQLCHGKHSLLSPFLTSFPLVCTYFFCLYSVSYPGEPWKQYFQDVKSSISWALKDHMEQSTPPPPPGTTLSFMWVKNKLVLLLCHQTFIPISQPTQCKMQNVYHPKPQRITFLRDITKELTEAFVAKKAICYIKSFNCSYVFSYCSSRK